MSLAPGFNPADAAIEKLKRGQLRDGAQLLELVRARRPDSPEMLFNLGVALSELGELTRAIEVLSHLVEVEPNHVHGRVALRVALGRSGDNASAADALATAVELAPADTWAEKNLGGILARLGRSYEARGDLETAVQLAPQDAQAWLLLGNICVSVGAVDAGRRALKQARTFDPPGPIRDRAELALNQLTADTLQRNADGLNPEALDAMIAALKRLRSTTPEARNQLTLQAALIGQKGLRLQDDARIHRLDRIPEPLTGLEVACLIHAGVQIALPGADTGFPLSAEFQVALSLHPNG